VLIIAVLHSEGV